MLKTDERKRSPARAAIGLTLTAVFVAACGLGMSTEDRLNRGQEAFDNADYRAAIIDARNILLDEPENVAARVLLGRSSVAVGDGATAEKELRRAAELGTDSSSIAADLGRALLMQGKFEDVIAGISPDSVTSDLLRHEVLRIRGDALIGLGQPVAARETFETVLRENGEDVLAQLGVVNSFVSEQNYPQARETLNQVLTFDDGFLRAWLVSGGLSMGMQDVERAASDYRRAAEIAAGYGDTASEMQALSGLANALLALRKAEETDTVLARMLEIGPSDTRTLLISARSASTKQNWTKAQENLQEVLRRIPEYRPAQLLLGIAHRESGNLSQAEMYLSAVVTAAPNNADARRLLAETRLQLGDAEQARQTLAPIIDEGTNDLTSLSMAAQASLNMGEFGDATDLLERGVAAEPDNIDLQLQLAFAHFQSGNADAAQKILRDLPVATIERNKIQRDSLLILTQMAQGELDEALQSASALVAHWPDRSESHGLMGSVELAMGDNEAARRSFNAAVELSPANLMSMYYLAQLDGNDGNPESAKARYLKILELQPENVQTMVSLAKLAAQAESHEETRDWLEKARSADPNASTPRRILAKMHLAYRDFAAAEELAEESLRLNEDDASLYDLLGQAQFSRNNFRGAELSFRRALELDERQPTYRINLANAQARRGNTAAAMATLSDQSGNYLKHIPTAVALASLKANSGAVDEASQIAAKLLQMHPDSAAPYALQAELLDRGGNPLEASRMYDKAMTIEVSDRLAVRAFQIRSNGGLPDPFAPLEAYLRERPLDDNIRSYLAQSYQSMQEFEKSNVQYEKVLKSTPDNFVALNNLAWNYLEIGDSRAEVTARRAYEIQPDNGSVADTLGWILIRKGNLDDGVSTLRQAVKLSDNSPEIRFHLAAGLVASGEATDAKVILMEILAVDDAFSSRQEAEELLATL